jgi:hypothetical protein
MIERDPKIVQSGLSRTVKKDGVTVECRSFGLSTKPSGCSKWSIPPARP